MPSRLNGFDYRMKWHIIQWPPSLPVSKAVNLHGNQRQMKTLPIDAAYPTWHREVFEVLSWSLCVNSRASCGAEPNCGIMQLARPHWHALLSSTQSLKKSSPRSIVSELPNCAQLVGAKASPTDRWPRAHRAPQGLNASTKEKKKRERKNATRLITYSRSCLECPWWWRLSWTTTTSDGYFFKKVFFCGDKTRAPPLQKSMSFCTAQAKRSLNEEIKAWQRAKRWPKKMLIIHFHKYLGGGFTSRSWPDL